jgi:hypothetical protein
MNTMKKNTDVSRNEILLVGKETPTINGNATGINPENGLELKINDDKIFIGSCGKSCLECKVDACKNN